MKKFIDPKSVIHDHKGTFTVEVEVPADSIWFDGHFPNGAILPGVAQLAMVAEILGDALQKPLGVASVSRVRFKQAIAPAERILVEITPKVSHKPEYGFRLLKGEELACSGFLQLSNKLVKGD